jgi:hypothetical protein
MWKVMVYLEELRGGWGAPLWRQRGRQRRKEQAWKTFWQGNFLKRRFTRVESKGMTKSAPGEIESKGEKDEYNQTTTRLAGEWKPGGEWRIVGLPCLLLLSSRVAF